MRKLDARQLAREKNLFRYSSALERADFSAVEAVLKEAERDPLLAQMIAEVNLVYESETFRLSPSLNHSSNHREKDLVMTTLVISSRQRNMQRWLPITLAAACVSMLFIGALMLHPIRPNNFLSGIQAQSSATPTAAATATVIPSPTAGAIPTIKQAHDLYLEGKFTEAAQAYEQIMHGQATDVDNLYGYGRVLVELNRAQEASAIADQILQINSQSINGYSLKALAQLELNDSDMALSTALKGYEINSNDATLLSIITRIYTALGNNQEALKFGDEAVGANTSASDAHYAYGLALANVGQHDDAIQQFESAINLNPNWPSTYYDLALQFKATNRLDAALTTYDQLLSLQPDNTNVMLKLCETYSQAGTSDIAETYCDKAVAADPKNAEAYQIRGEVLFRRRNYEMAIQDFKQCVTLGSKAAECYYQQGLADYYIGGTANCDSAWNLLQQSLGADGKPENPVQTIIINGLQLVKENCPKYKDIDIPTLATPAAVVAQISAVPPAVVPPDIQFSASAVGTPVCGGIKVITQNTFVHARPSNKSTIIGGVKAGMQVEAMVTGIAEPDDTTMPKSDWFFIKADVNGNSVQGWVNANETQPTDPAQPCPTTLTTDAGVSSAVAIPYVVPANGNQAATVAPFAVQPVFSIAGTPVCINAITMDGSTAHVTNQTDKDATIFAAPLTSNSNASVIGTLPAKANAMLLYQQYDRQSAPEGALWYLIMTNGAGDKQVTGWISANSITLEQDCSSEANVTSGTTAVISPAQLEPITGIAVTGSTQIGTCHIINLSPAPATLFAAPLTSDSNAPIVGTLSANGDGVVIFQNYDAQSAPIGALWYLVTTSGNQQVTGWVSASSINSASVCAPEQLTGVTLSSGTFTQVQANAIPVPDVADSAQAASCHITNTTGKAVTLFAAPLTADSNAAVVGEFPANGEATVILQNYDQQSDPIGALWYLITTSGDKPVTGWLSANSINSSNACTPQIASVSAVPLVASQAQASGVVAVGGTTASSNAPTGICQMVNQKSDSVPVYSEPSNKSDESTLVNNLPPAMPGTVLYQQRNKATGKVWYLVLAVAEQGKQISGWVSADSVTTDGGCPALP